MYSNDLRWPSSKNKRQVSVHSGFAEPEGVEHREQVVFHVHPVILRRIGAVQPVDVGVQHLGNRNFAEIALDCV